ncbi:MAG TPA: uroporphyrinogen-III C-methyltransferase [Candidatus Saccharimonadales bacterium]|nr:uroporphyrinogen-III C-methyltransferase [Candidatus Saccharimonadales bacterium]
MKSKGTVYLVGAGPGDAGLMTMRGAELLGRADVVVYDALVNPDLLRLAPKTAEIIYGGKRAKAHAIPQEELNQLLVSKAREGKTVVRLKGGDPYIFGRGGEEAEELADAEISFEVVPGISSVVAGPNYAGIPITHRDHCSSFTVVTGHEDPTKPESSLDYEKLARLPGTKVILMGVERIEQIAASLIGHGMPAKTPVGMVRWGTTGQQQTIEGTLENIAAVAKKQEFSAPAVTIIGDVLKLRAKLNWFEKRPLFGQRVVVTRTREQASQLSKQLLDLGAEVVEIPTIKIAPPDNLQNVADVLLELGTYDWLVFTSPNGVTTFFEYFFKGFEDMRDLGGARIAAVGPGTAAKLKELHLKVELMPEEYVTRKIAEAFAKYETIENLKILLLRAEVANKELPMALEEMGAIVDDIACYKTVPETEDRTQSAARLLESGADWITFTSSSTVENFHARFDLPKLLKQFPKIRLLSIGPETSKAIKVLGLSPAVEAREHNIDGMVKTLLHETKAKRK